MVVGSNPTFIPSIRKNKKMDEENNITFHKPFQITCPSCSSIFEANDETVMFGGETPSTEVIWIECPNCGYEQEF